MAACTLYLTIQVYSDPVVISWWRWGVTHLVPGWGEDREHLALWHKAGHAALLQLWPIWEHGPKVQDFFQLKAGQGSTFPLVDSQADTNTTAPMKTCLAPAMKEYVWGLVVYSKCRDPAVQELIWLKALLQCRFRDIWDCPELPGRIHRWCFFWGSSLAVYFADDGKGRKRKLQLHLSRFFKYRAM